MTARQSEHMRLDVRGLTRRFGGRRVVDAVHLSVSGGQVVCLLGPSGCGKSTTLRMIAGVETADEGEIHVDGHMICGPGVHAPPEQRHIGLMFQDFALFPHLSVGANVAFGLKGTRRENEVRAREMLGRVGLESFYDAYPDSLSGGEQQRVALARALAPKPRIMLMDEPFSGLDNRLRDGIRDETLELLKEEKTAVVLVTHDPDEAMRMADEISLMRDGRIIQRGAPYQFYTAPIDRDALAFFSDINEFEGVVQGGSVQLPFGNFAAPDLRDGDRAIVAIRPGDVRIDFDRATPVPSLEDGTPLRAEVRRARFMGRDSLVELGVQDTGTTVSVRVRGAFMPPVGQAFVLSIPRSRAFVFPAPA